MKELLFRTLFALSSPAWDSRTAGIYVLFRDDVIVYIGQSNWCETRVQRHIIEGTKTFDRFTIVPLTGDRAHRHQVETEMIFTFRPEYNVILHDRDFDCEKDSTKLHFVLDGFNQVELR